MTIKKLYFTKDYSKDNTSNSRINVAKLIKRAKDVQRQDKKKVLFYSSLAISLLIITGLVLSI